MKEHDKKQLPCFGNRSHFGFGAIHVNHFVWSNWYDVNKMEHFPRSLDRSTRVAEIFGSANYPTQPNPALLHNFEYFRLVRDHAEGYYHETKDLKSDFSWQGAWNQGSDIDPTLEENDDYPTHGKVCDTMKYFGFNPTKINKFDHLSRLPHPASGSHYFFEWLGFPGGYRAIVESDRQLDGDIVALSATDRARQDLHIPYSPDDGATFITRTMEKGINRFCFSQKRL